MRTLLLFTLLMVGGCGACYDQAEKPGMEVYEVKVSAYAGQSFYTLNTTGPNIFMWDKTGKFAVGDTLIIVSKREYESLIEFKAKHEAQP